jgi:SAM-dependent methyltransferase
MVLETQIKNFYSKLRFPGPYTMADIEHGGEYVVNRYLDWYDQQISDAELVCDIGCGSGFLTHWLAKRYPRVQFHALDFCDSIDFAMTFGHGNSITNVSYIKQDFLEWRPKNHYDLVICNGVLHHIPRLELACQRLNQMQAPRLAIGIYNRFGKMAKRLFPVRYVNDTLYQDQEMCPFEMSFTNRGFLALFPGYQTTSIMPSYRDRLVDFINLFNYHNGGLTLYALQLQDSSTVDQ